MINESTEIHIERKNKSDCYGNRAAMYNRTAAAGEPYQKRLAKENLKPMLQRQLKRALVQTRVAIDLSADTDA